RGRGGGGRLGRGNVGNPDEKKSPADRRGALRARWRSPRKLRARAIGRVVQRGRTMKIITADQRLAEKGGAKILIIGPSGVGKTNLLRTLRPEQLAACLFVDIEAGDIAVSDLPIASVRPRTWAECRDLACALGGFNPALPATATYSEAHYNEVMKNPELAQLT